MESPETNIEQHWRVKPLAKRLGVSPQTIARLFNDRPGVKVLGNRNSTRTRRRYTVALIPESVVQQYLDEIET